jgi:uncharacterized protein
MVRIILIYFFLCVSFVNAYTQNIQRKGSLGISFYPSIPDSLVKKLNYKKGCVVRLPVKSTTADAIGLQSNDIITEVNGIEIVLPNQILAVAKTLRANETVTVKIIRNDKEQVLNGKVVAKPFEISTTATISYGEFAYKNGYVRTIYRTPLNSKPIGTIYFLQGLPCYSLDNRGALDKTKQALDAMAERGFAVYCIEKGDMGDNVNMQACDGMSFNEELEMYEAGYTHLLTLKTVDTEKIFLFGHSMGGVTAPLLAQKFQPKGVAVYGTVFKPWMEYLMDAFIMQPQYYGQDAAALRDKLEKIKPYIYDYFYSDKSINEIVKTKEGLQAFQDFIEFDAKTKLGASGRNMQVHKDMNTHNIAKAWRNTKSYVLAVYGECDIAAINADDHQAIASYVNKNRPGKGTFWLAPGATHTFEDIGTMEEFIKWQSKEAEYLKYAQERFSTKIFDYVCNWMKEVAAKG